MKVKNVPDTSGRPPCPCGPWIKHFRKHSEYPGEICYANDCKVKVNKDDLVGAHVLAGDTEYIVPLCKACNARKDEFEVNPKILKVHAKALDRCGAN